MAFPKLQAAWRRTAGFFRKGDLERQMAEEMRAHLDCLAARNVAAGMSEEDARFAALRSFGGVEQVKERGRDERGLPWLEAFSQDLRYAGRQLRRSPGFALVAILTLGLGIGANTAFFTAIDVLLLNTLPVQAPQDLVLLTRDAPASGPSGLIANEMFSYPLYEQFRDQGHSLAGLAAMSYGSRTIAADGIGDAGVETVFSAEVSGNFFAVVGVPMTLGRPLGAIDDRTDNPQPAVVLSHAFWTRRFGSDPGIVGRTVLLDDIRFTVVGVTAREFTGVDFGPLPNVWLPQQMIRLLEAGGAQKLHRSGSAWLKLIGRRRPGVTRPAAEAELNVIFQRQVADLANQLGAQWAKSPQRRILDGQLVLLDGKGGYNTTLKIVHPLLVILLAVVTLVLLIASANVASLLLARSAARQREFAVRAALGAGRGRLIRQMLTETLLLSVIGGACGLLLAQWGLDLMLRYFVPAGILQASAVSVSPDLRITGFTLLVSAVTGVVVGLASALRFSRIDLVTATKEQGGTGARSRQRFNQVIVVTQIAVSVCLLAGAGLFMRTLQNLREVDLGFDHANLLVVRLDRDKKADAVHNLAVARELLAALGALPDVRGVTVSEGAFRSGGQLKFQVDGYLPAPGEDPVAHPTFAGPDFFVTWRIPLERGRGFEAAELFSTDASAAPGSAAPGAAVAVISESLARKYFPGGDPLGRELRTTDQGVVTIIGVARDVMFESVRGKSPYVIYLPIGRNQGQSNGFNFQIRTGGDPMLLVPDIRALSRRLAPAMPMHSILSVDQMLGYLMLQERIIAQLTGFFGAFAVLLACIGLYGMLAYTVTQRTREIGIRMALGARTTDVIRLVIGQGIGLAGVGCTIGIVGVVLLLRLAGRLLYGVTSTDPLTLVATVALLLGVAVMASWLPARRATKVDPVIALRAE